MAEVERLNSLNKNPRVRYEDGFVVYKDWDKHYPPEIRNEDSFFYNSFRKSSAARVSEVKNYNYIQNNFNAGEAVVHSSRFLQLDDFVKENNIPVIDFIKTDTDGYDLPVLLGSEKILESCNVLGLEVESIFHGSPHPYANTFSNIDRFLKTKGFSLFNLETYFYSRGALPAQFLYDIFAQTRTGKVEFAEAFYFRDLAKKDYEQKFNFKVTLDMVLKLACLYEVFGLNDCAAELLMNRAGEFGFEDHLDTLLDALTPRFKGQKLTYKEYIKKFDENPEAFFPQSSATENDIQKEISWLLQSKLWKVVKPFYSVLKFFRRLCRAR